MVHGGVLRIITKADNSASEKQKDFCREFLIIGSIAMNYGSFLDRCGYRVPAQIVWHFFN